MQNISLVCLFSCHVFYNLKPQTHVTHMARHATSPKPTSPVTSSSSSPLLLTALVCVRMLSAAYSNVSDCDETFNYWDPVRACHTSQPLPHHEVMVTQLHYLVHGSGQQTWEYSPLYGLRSYAYLLPAAAPAYVLGHMGVAKVPCILK